MLLHVEYPRILNILKIFKILEVEVLWYTQRSNYMKKQKTEKSSNFAIFSFHLQNINSR